MTPCNEVDGVCPTPFVETEDYGLQDDIILTLADDELIKPLNCLALKDLPNCAVSIYPWLS